MLAAVMQCEHEQKCLSTLSVLKIECAHAHTYILDNTGFKNWFHK